MLGFYILFAIFGLCVGSFANVLILRIPKGKSISFPASHCPKCQHKLKAWHNIPVISYVFLGGKCAFCKCQISAQYPLIELGSALLALLSFALCDEPLNALFLSLTLILLLALSVIDFRESAVPESLLVFAYIFALFSAHKGFDELFSYTSPFSLSLLFMGGIFLIKSFVSAWKNRKNQHIVVENMGDADVIIFGVIGALFGLQIGFYVIFASAILQLVLHIIFHNKKDGIPFIPALSLSIFGFLLAKLLGFLNV